MRRTLIDWRSSVHLTKRVPLFLNLMHKVFQTRSEEYMDLLLELLRSGAYLDKIWLKSETKISAKMLDKMISASSAFQGRQRHVANLIYRFLLKEKWLEYDENTRKTVEKWGISDSKMKDLIPQGMNWEICLRNYSQL